MPQRSRRLTVLGCLALCAGLVQPLQPRAEEALPALGPPAAGQPAAAATPGATPAAGPYSARGVLEPRAEALLSAELDARIAALPFKEGERFVKGDRLVEFDCTLYKARLAAAQAAREVERLQYKSDQQLAKLNSIGDLELRQTAARLRQADADVEVAGFAVERCAVAAPFDGRVVQRLVHAHESVAAGQELLTVVDVHAPDIRLIVPSGWLAWLAPGQAFQFTVDETGERLPGHVERIGARIDPVSQTLPVIGAFDTTGPAGAGLLAGMSGTADFSATAPGASQ